MEREIQAIQRDVDAAAHKVRDALIACGPMMADATVVGALSGLNMLLTGVQFYLYHAANAAGEFDENAACAPLPRVTARKAKQDAQP